MNYSVTTMNQALELREYRSQLERYEEESKTYHVAALSRAIDIVVQILHCIENDNSDRYVLVLNENTYCFSDWYSAMHSSADEKSLDFPTPPTRPVAPSTSSDAKYSIAERFTPSAWGFIFDAMKIIFYVLGIDQISEIEKLFVGNSVVVFITIP